MSGKVTEMKGAGVGHGLLGVLPIGDVAHCTGWVLFGRQWTYFGLRMMRNIWHLPFAAHLQNVSRKTAGWVGRASSEFANAVRICSVIYDIERLDWIKPPVFRFSLYAITITDPVDDARPLMMMSARFAKRNQDPVTKSNLVMKSKPSERLISQCAVRLAVFP
jgi:hypothetical protein